MVVAMDIGSAFEALDVRSYTSRSADGGKTWSMPALIFEPDTSHHAVSLTTRVSRATDGMLTAWACQFERSRTDCGLVNEATDGFVPMSFSLLRSTDAGKTWSTPQAVTLPTEWSDFETCSPVIEVAAGRWLVPTSPVKNFAGERSHLPPGMAFVSNDAGQTWNSWVTTFGKDAAGLCALEQKLTRLSDGRWLIVCWSIDAAGKTVPNRYAIADVAAKSFGPSRSTAIAGETCTPIALSDGRVLAVYRNYDRPGLWAQIARIDGDTWRAENDLCLWQGSTGVGQEAQRFAELRQMKDLRFGCPSLAILPDGDVMVVFWCVENCVGNIRWIRVKTDA